MPAQPSTEHAERRAKVGVPLLPNSIPSRPRLIRLFEESLARTPLIVVRAPQGAGKTTAAADWAAASQSPVIWASVEAAEVAEATASLWVRILRSCWLMARPGSEFHVITGRALADIENGESMREVLLRSILDAGPVTLVVDGLSQDDGPSFLKDLRWLLRRGGGFRAVVILDADLVAEEAWRLHSIDVTWIEDEQLHLTLEEVAAQIRRHGSDLDPELVRTHTFGYPLLIRALLSEHSLRPVTGGAEGLASLVDSWVRTSIFKFLPHAAEHRDFLLKTSLAETLTVELAFRLTGREDAAAILSDMVSMRIIRDEGSGVFSFPLPALGALQKELMKSMPDEVPRLRAILAEHHLTTGDVFRGLELAIQNRDFDTVSRAVVRHKSYLLYDHPKCAVRILNEVPDAILRTHLPLALTLGHLLSQTLQGRHRGEALLEAALASAEMTGTGRPQEERMVVPLAQMMALRVTGRFTEAVRRAPAAVEAFETRCENHRSEFAAVLVATQIQAGLTFLLDGWTVEARAMLYQAASAPPSARTGAGQLGCLGLIALTYAVDGNIKEAEKILLEAEPLHLQCSSESRTQMPYLLARTWCLLEREDLQSASRFLARAESCSPEGELWPVTVMLRTLTDMLVSPESLDLDEMDRAASGAYGRPVSSFGQALLSGVLSLAHLAQGNASKAASAAEQIKASPLAALSRARVALASSDFAAAERLLPGEDSARQYSERVAVQRLLMLSAVRRQAGSLAAADEAQNQAQTMLTRTGMGTVMLMLPEPAMRHLRPGSNLQQFVDGAARFVIPAIARPAQLTAREAVVLKALASSETASAAARQLEVSLNTVKAQSRSIYRKLGVGTLRGALNEAGRRGLI